MGLLKETLSRSGAIGTGEIEVVDDGQGIQLTMADTMQAMMSKCELAVAAFNAGTGTLEELGTLGRYGFNQTFVSVIKQEEGGIGRSGAVEEGL